MASCHTHATICQSSHRIHRIHRSFLRRIFSHGFHRSTQKLVPLRGCTCLKCTSRARSAPTEQTCHLFCLCSRDSCTPWLAAWVWQGCHTLLICAHLCLSVGGTSLPECSVCSAYSVGHSLPVCLFGSVVVFSHGFHGIHRMLGCVIGGVGMAGCHTLLISAHLCLSVGGTSLLEGSVCSAYSVGHSLPVCFVGSVVVFSPRNSRNPRNVRLRYWQRGYGRDAIPS